jgi:hypothetical protein
LDLEQRIQCLEDIEAIKQLKARWWFCCDTRDTAGMRACFDEDDFEIDFGFIGRFTDMNAFIGVFESLACHPTHIDMHHGLAPEITIKNAHTAEGRWRMRFQLLETHLKQVQLMSGYYEDQYVKLADGWKMRRSKYTLMSNLHLESSDAGISVAQIGAGPGLVGEGNATE